MTTCRYRVACDRALCSHLSVPNAFGGYLHRRFRDARCSASVSQSGTPVALSRPIIVSLPFTVSQPFTPARCAPVRSAGQVRVRRFAPVRFAPVRFASVRSAPFRSAPVRSRVTGSRRSGSQGQVRADRFASFRCAPARSAGPAVESGALRQVGLLQAQDPAFALAHASLALSMKRCALPSQSKSPVGVSPTCTTS